MKNKIKADNWFIACYYDKDGNTRFHASIDYSLGDERNSKKHPFDTFEEAYQWIKNQVVL